MDPISLAVLTAIGLYVLAAPDPITASARSGAASAIGSASRAAGQSIRADMAARSTSRSQAHQDRIDRWKQAGTRSARIALKLDRVFGKGGPIESAGRRIGAHLKAAKQAAAVGWRDGKQQGQPGLPKALKQRLAPAARSARSAVRTARGTAQPTSKPASAGGTNGPRSSGVAITKPAPNGAGGTNTVANKAQPINTEAGLLPVAEQIETATAELAALIEAAQASEDLPESLKFDPGAEVKAAMSTLASATPSPDTLRAWGEAATGFKQAVEEHVTAVVGA